MKVNFTNGCARKIKVVAKEDIKMKDFEMMYRMPGEDLKMMEGVNKKNTYECISGKIQDCMDACRHGELDMYVDDAGLMKELEPNILIKRSRTNNITDRDTLLVGPVVFTSTDHGGNTISLTPKAKEIIANMKPARLGFWQIYIIEAY